MDKAINKIKVETRSEFDGIIPKKIKYMGREGKCC